MCVVNKILLELDGLNCVEKEVVELYKNIIVCKPLELNWIVD